MRHQILAAKFGSLACLGMLLIAPAARGQVPPAGMDPSSTRSTLPPPGYSGAPMPASGPAPDAGVIRAQSSAPSIPANAPPNSGEGDELSDQDDAMPSSPAPTSSNQPGFSQVPANPSPVSGNPPAGVTFGGAPPAAGGAPAAPSGSPSNSGEGDELSDQDDAGSGKAKPKPGKMPADPLDLKLTASFGKGFGLATADDEYRFEFHQLTQFDGHFFEQGNMEGVADSFAFPRQWLIFSGRLTKPFEYFLAAAHGFDNGYTILDAYLNIHFDDRLQVKLGRYKTPFTYEFYSLPIDGLIDPERSIFFNNFGLNRDLGAMAWGMVWDKRMDWAAGIFNGNPNTFSDTNPDKDIAAFVNVRPFETSEVDFLKFLNFGGSVNAGNQLGPVRPQTLRLQTAIPGNATAGVPWLSFDPDVIEFGPRAFWSMHAAWYNGPVSINAEWQSGFQTYSHRQDNIIGLRTQVPVSSYYVTLATFLTGETVSRRGMASPLRPFDIRPGRRGPGAWEPFVRYNYLQMGEQVFNAELANRSQWTNKLQTIDIGVNWYWTQYIKLVFMWEHADFGSPVKYNAAGDRHLTSDEFLFRCQFSF
jgi:phosphate-selective porin OprO/OprP